jgi:surface antigen
LRNQLGGCTNYVAQKRDVSDFPNASGQPGHPGDAQYWDNQARQAGYEVGSRPVVGSIMVFEPDHGKPNGIMNVHDTAGHVAYVEKVERIDGGYKVTISQASTKYVDGQFVRGTYINQNTMTVTVNDGQQAASFVYDKPAK